MILVSTGTNGPAFDRLLTVVAGLGADGELVVQHGPSSIRPAGARCVAYLSFDEYVRLVGEADTVVTHAGAGSVLVALMCGKRPLVVPRLARFGEVVDDHQLGFARRLAAAGLVTLVEDPSSLEGMLRSEPSGRPAAGPRSARSPLVDDLRTYLADAAAAKRTRDRNTAEAVGPRS